MSSHVLRRLILIGLMIAISAVLTALNPVFLSAGNINKMFQEAAQIGIVAIGFTLVMITAGIDMSVGGIIAMTAMLSINFIAHTRLPVFLFVPLTLAVGALTGLVNGFFIARFNLPAFIVTLATKGILSGMALVFAVKDAKGFVQNVYIDNDAYLWFGSDTFGGIYRTAIAFLLLGLATQFFLKNTRAGTNIYASGANPTAAALTGINVERATVGVYVFGGICASIAAIFISSRMMTAMPELGLGMEMDVIASVVIGGTPFTGGSGDVWGTVLGSIFLALIKNGILKLGMSPWIQPIVIGGVIIVTVIIDVTQKHIAENLETKAKLKRLDAAAVESAALGGEAS